jgi:hypothetical protein
MQRVPDKARAGVPPLIGSPKYTIPSLEEEAAIK